jgi:cytochrome c biogenesis protein CcdA
LKANMINRSVHLLTATAGSQALLIALLLIFIFLIPQAASEPGSILIEYFYEDNCYNCAHASPVINDIIKQNENITLIKYEISSEYDGITGYDHMKMYGVYSVPALVINRQITITYSDYEGNITLLNELIINGINNAPLLIENNSIELANEIEPPSKLSLLGVLITGLLIGFNPCLIAVMTFLATITLSSKGGRRDLLMMVGGFCAGIFIVYMLVGLCLLSVIKQQPQIKNSITLFLVVMIGLMGLWHLYDADYLSRNKSSSFKTPKSFKWIFSSMKGKNIIIISCIAGGIFSLVKAPCIGPVYFAIIDMLISKGKIAEGSIYLSLYNLGVVFPILVLGVLLSFGLSPEKVSALKEKWRVEIRFITGEVLIVLALMIYFNII